MRNIKTLIGLAAVALLCALPQATFASLVTLPNPTPTGTLDISASSATVVGLLVASLSSNFQAPPASGVDFSGTLLSQVYDTGSGYTFVYTLTEIAGPQAIARLSVAGWLSSEILQVGNLTTSANFAQSADRTAGNLGEVVGFNFNAGLGVGVSQLVIATDLSHYTQTTAGISDGASTTAAALSVPEPTTMIAGALLLLPFGASTLRILRKTRTA
jgi:hypothetical protein